jgi:hypothetical protein
MYLEEICLSTTADAPEADAPAEQHVKTAELRQASRMRRCEVQLTLFSNNRLRVAARGLMQTEQDYTLDIGILDPQPKRRLKLCWSHVLLSAALAGAAWFVSLVHPVPHSTTLSVSLVLCSVTALLVALYRSHDRLVFFSHHGRAPLVVLFRGLPERAAFDAFTTALAKQIRSARSGCPDVSDTLSQELKAHRHLMQQGAISQRRYDIVKQRILSQHSSAPRAE